MRAVQIIFGFLAILIMTVGLISIFFPTSTLTPGMVDRIFFSSLGVGCFCAWIFILAGNHINKSH